MVIEFRWMVIEFRWMVIEFRWMVIKFRDDWSSKSEANWLKQSPPNTILHSFLYSVKLQMISMKCHRNQKHIGRNNHLQTLFNNHCYIMSTWNNVHQNAITSKHYMTLSKKLQAKPSQECKRVWERKKTSFSVEVEMNFSFQQNFLWNCPPPHFSFYDHSSNVIRWMVISVLVV